MSTRVSTRSFTDDEMDVLNRVMHSYRDDLVGALSQEANIGASDRLTTIDQILTTGWSATVTP